MAPYKRMWLPFTTWMSTKQPMKYDFLHPMLRIATEVAFLGVYV